MNILDSITLKEVLNFYDQYLSVRSTKTKHLCIQVFGTGNTSLKNVEVKDEIEILEKKLLSAEARKEFIVLENPQDYHEMTELYDCVHYAVT